MTGFLIISTAGLSAAAVYGIFSFTVLRKIAQREARKKREAEETMTVVADEARTVTEETVEERR